MKLDQFKLLTDENIHRDVVQFLRARGFDVLDATKEGLCGRTDVDLLQRAVSEDRVVVTHDRDFGTLAILAGEQIVGIVYLRPGHIDPKFTIETIRAVLKKELDLSPPFILVVQRTERLQTQKSEHSERCGAEPHRLRWQNALPRWRSGGHTSRMLHQNRSQPPEDSSSAASVRVAGKPTKGSSPHLLPCNGWYGSRVKLG